MKNMKMKRTISVFVAAAITAGTAVYLSCSAAGVDTIGDMSGLRLIDNESVKYSVTTASVSSNSPTEEYEAALALQSTLSEMCNGASFKLVTSYNAKRTKEIIVGRDTAQETNGLFTVDRSVLCDSGFIVKTDGERIIITGKTAEGTWNGVEYFVKNYLGYDVWNDTAPKNIKSIAVPRSINHITVGENGQTGALKEVTDTGAFAVRQYGDIDYDTLFTHNAYDRLRTASVCYSDEKTVTNIISKRVPGGRIVYNSLATPCDCAACKAAAQEEGTEMGAYFRLVRRAAEENPDKRITVLASNRTLKAPSTSLGSNVDVLLCDRKLCSAHSVGDSSCPINKAFAENLQAWKKVCGRVTVVDFTSDYFYFPSTFPNLFVLKENAEYYKNAGVYGVYMQFDTKMSDLEFADLRKYLTDAVLKNPSMSDSVYSGLMDDAIAYYYGEDNAEAIRAYIDLSTDKAEQTGKCFDIYSVPDEVLPMKTGDGSGVQGYDISFAREAYKLWNGILPYPSNAVSAKSRYSLAIAGRYMSGAANHAKIQFSTYLSSVIDAADRTEVIRAVIAG